MKRLLLAVIATLFIAGSASSADLSFLERFAHDFFIGGVQCSWGPNTDLTGLAKTVWAMQKLQGPEGLYEFDKRTGNN